MLVRPAAARADAPVVALVVVVPVVLAVLAVLVAPVSVVVGWVALPVVAVAVAVVAAVARVPRVPSVVPVVRPNADASLRSSAGRNLTRWRRPRLVACASVRVTVKSSGYAAVLR